jgi:hypothetical protein
LPTELHDDTPPPEPRTPAASVRARPAWAGTSGAEVAYAPQIGDGQALFLAATSLAGDLEGAFVTCRVETFAHADIFAGDDLLAHATFGAMPLVGASGPDNANLAFVSAPLVTLHRDEDVAFDVYDRDLFENELITDGKVTYKGKGLRLQNGGASIECRALQGEALDRQARHYGDAAARANAALSSAKLDLRKPDWGWPEGKINASERAASDVAALVGWADPRAASRVADVATVKARLETDRAGAFAELLQSAGAETVVRDLHVHLDAIECGPSGRACVARVTVTNEGAVSAPVSAYVANEGTGPVGARVTLADGASRVAPGASAGVTIAPSSGTSLDEGSAVIGVCVSDACATLTPPAR